MESEKTKIDRFLLTLDHSDIILFLPYLSRTPPSSIVGFARIIDLHQVCPAVGFWGADVGKSTKPADNRCKSVGF
jgi:hypothetical protein